MFSIGKMKNRSGHKQENEILWDEEFCYQLFLNQSAYSLGRKCILAAGRIHSIIEVAPSKP